MLRYQLRLHAGARAEPDYFPALIAKVIGNGKSREYVASGAARHDQDRSRVHSE